MKNKEKEVKENVWKKAQVLWIVKISFWLEMVQMWESLPFFFARIWFVQLFLQVGYLNRYPRYFAFYILVLLILPRQLTMNNNIVNPFN